MIVIKKDGTREKFKKEKLLNAIGKSATRVGLNLGKHLSSTIYNNVRDVAFIEDNEIPVEELHHVVEAILEEISPAIAKSYKDYRNYKTELSNRLKVNIYSKAKKVISSRGRENSNSNENYASTKRVELAKQIAKEMYQDMYIPVPTLQAMKDGYVYIHDLSDMMVPQFNCCLMDVANILKGGFTTEGIFNEEPRDVKVAIGFIKDIISIVSAQHYGGNTTPQIDKVIAPYYKMSISHYFNKNVERGMSVENAEFYAKFDAYKDMKKALRGLEHSLNIVVSARGSFPFTTFSFGDVADEYERDVAKAILEVRMEGHGPKGKKKTMIFPKLVMLYDETEAGQHSLKDEIFDLAVKCSSKCMYPDFIGSFYKRHGKWVSPMGCRAYLSDYFIDGEAQFTGRFNIGAISLNLPMIWMKAKSKGLNFEYLLDNYLEMIRQQHLHRYEYLGKAKASSNPLMFMEGGALGGNLKENDRIEPLLEHATASFGITALHELTLLATGKTLKEDNSFAIKVMDHINRKVDEFKKEDGKMYAIYNTPAESLCGTQVQQFRAIYGEVKGVSDKEYFTNSNHLWVGEKITPIEKQDKEIELFKKSMGGHIGYVKITNPDNLVALKRIILRGLSMGYYQGVNFEACSCNHCGHQGNYFGDSCPKCGSIDINQQDRTCGYLGFSKKSGDHTFNDAKMAEIKDRVSM